VQPQNRKQKHTRSRLRRTLHSGQEEREVSSSACSKVRSP
jgi:hypothetical protein